MSYVEYSSNVREFLFFNKVVSKLYALSTEWKRERERERERERNNARKKSVCFGKKM